MSKSAHKYDISYSIIQTKNICACTSLMHVDKFNQSNRKVSERKWLGDYTVVFKFPRNYKIKFKPLIHTLMHFSCRNNKWYEHDS